MYGASKQKRQLNKMAKIMMSSMFATYTHTHFAQIARRFRLFSIIITARMKLRSRWEPSIVSSITVNVVVFSVFMGVAFASADV